jgi:ppGpp synthetase/RelA/SpoT-type nucleotidyltranferase
VTVKKIMGSIEIDTSAIKAFLKEWPKYQHFYEAIASTARDICVKSLQQRDIRCSAESRVKETASLERKLYARQKARSQPYKEMADIPNDIVDLAGVRIRLYFPSQSRAVGRIIRRAFIVKNKKKFPEHANGEDTAMTHDEDHEYQSDGDLSDKDEPDEEDDILDALPELFPGYRADHYHVNLRPEVWPPGKNWETGRVEIQVVSIMRHVWAEVEHDLVYKNLAVAGDAERLVLKALSGTIELGERLLNQLYDLQRFNVPFETVHDLGSYLLQYMQVKMDGRYGTLGEVDLLWQLLRATGLNGRQQFRKVLGRMDFSVHSQGLSPVSVGVGRHTIRPTVINYIMDEIVRSACAERKVAAQLELRRSQGEENEYKLEAIIDSFILVSHLFGMEERVALVMDTKGTNRDRAAWDRVIEMVEWLHGDQPWKFYERKTPLNRKGKGMIDGLWAHSESHDQRPMQMVFRLARLGVVKTSVADRTRLVPALETLISLAG